MNAVARTTGQVRIVGAGLLGASLGHVLTSLGVDVVLADASRTALSMASTSASPGTGWSGQGHQNSIASKPACLAAAGRSSSSSSWNSNEQLAAYLSW